MLSNINDRFLQTRLLKDEKYVKIGFVVFGTFLFILIVDIVYLHTLFLQNKQTTKNITRISPASQLSSSPSTQCSNCTSPIPASITLAPSLPTQNIQTAVVKDYFIPLGSGTSQAANWTDVPGVQATIDFGSYKHIKEIHFEASVYIPNANQTVSVRLYNVTDDHPVWYSDVLTNGNAQTYLSSSPVVYDTGSKLYQVQMKTQLQAPANLVQARIHVMLQ